MSNESATIRRSETSPPEALDGVADARTLLSSWLLGPIVQLGAGPHAGAAIGWTDSDGNGAYVYPEITGYYLQWLAWQAACHGARDDTRRRAAAAQRWLRSWVSTAGVPATRVYLRTSDPDWRNSALFFFDLAMVMRGLASVARIALIDVDERLVDRLSQLLLMLVARDGMFEACIATGEVQLPIRWSTRRGAFLAKAASGVLLASEQFPTMPAALQDAADATFGASLRSMVHESHGDTHALLYGIEGALGLPNHPAAARALPQIARQLRDLLKRCSDSGHLPESLLSDGRTRLDIVAQAVRAMVLALSAWDSQEGVHRMTRALVGHVDPARGIPFSPSERPVQYNAWTAMFAEQAFFAAQSNPSSPLLADLRLYLV
jgi:hypothetical protein